MRAIAPGCYPTRYSMPLYGAVVGSAGVVALCQSSKTGEWGRRARVVGTAFTLTKRASGDTIIVEMIEHMPLDSTKNSTIYYNFYGKNMP